MSTLSSLDGGDLHETLRKHQFRKRWLAQAEEWLRSDRDIVPLTTYDIRWGDGPTFTFEVGRAIWEPQLRAQVEEAKRQVAELDRIVREYIEAALTITL
jgi:hypothetical protein